MNSQGSRLAVPAIVGVAAVATIILAFGLQVLADSRLPPPQTARVTQATR